MVFDKIQVTTEDERYMLEALREAAKAAELGEVPVGAVIVRNGEIIAASEGYKAKASCLNGIESIRKNAVDAPIIKE